MTYALLLVAACFCAVRALRARRLLASAMWLAAVSALVSIVLYRLGAEQVAVVELSVGAGLVTVLFVFAISIAGDDGLAEGEFFPNWLAAGMSAVLTALLVAMILPIDIRTGGRVEAVFKTVFWQDRELDVLLQLVLVFTGVLALLHLLAEMKQPFKLSFRSRRKTIDVPQSHLSTTPDTARGPHAPGD